MMITNSNFIKITNPGDLKSFNSKELGKLRHYESNGSLNFLLPKRFKKNSDRKIYKTGFLFTFLNELYPMKNYDEICEIMNIRYHVFLEKRQVQRSSLLFNSNEFYIN